MTALDAADELRLLIASFHGLVVVETGEEERFAKALEGACNGLDVPLFTWAANTGLRRGSTDEALGSHTRQAQGALGHIMDLTIDGVFWFKDFTPHLGNSPLIRREFREVAEKFCNTRSAMVVSGHAVDLPEEVRHISVAFDIGFPGELELLEVLQETVTELAKTVRFTIDLTPETQRELLKALAGLTRNQARQAIAHAILEDKVLDSKDISNVLEKKSALVRDSGALEFYSPTSLNAEVGGFVNLKAWLDRAHHGFSDGAAALNLPRPKGLLLVGVQGCGKSLCAKAVAQRWGLPLLKLDSGALYNKYVGETERNFREATRLAGAVSPCILWIDELEKAFGKSGDDTDGGTSRRLLGAFLTWLQEKPEGIFVVGTANNIDALAPEFLRKGRFDETFFIDLPAETARSEIFSIHIRKRDQDPAAFDISSLVTASHGFSGAEIEAAVVTAAYDALYRELPLSTDLILGTLGQTVPLSVSRREDITALREYAGARFVAAG